MKRRRKEKGVQSTRQLMGITRIEDVCICTPYGDLVYFIVQPTNISVLPRSGIEARVQALLNVLRSLPEMELLAMNSRESFENNKAFYQSRIEQEPLPKIRQLLELDSGHLDEIQVLSTLAREFYFVMRIRGKKEKSILRHLTQIEKSIEQHGFTVRIAGKEDLKRMLAVYYAQDVTSDRFQNYDGEQWAKEVEQRVLEEEKTNG